MSPAPTIPPPVGSVVELRKPRRIACLLPELTLDAGDASLEREVGLLCWLALIEACARHPQLAVLEPEATPLFPQDGRFTPAHAGRGAAVDDAFYGPTRRDELLWLELSLSSARPLVVRLHARDRAGKARSVEAVGRSLGAQLQQALTMWLAERNLAAPGKALEAITLEDLIATARALGPTLLEQARGWAAGSAQEARAEALPPGEPPQPPADDADDDDPDTMDVDVDDAQVIEATTVADIRGLPALIAKLPACLRAVGVRLLGLGLREELSTALLSVDPTHPHARFARLTARGEDLDLLELRAVIATAPGWAAPYAALAGVRRGRDPDAIEPTAARPPSELEAVAAASLAAVLRPDSLPVLEAAGERLSAAGRVDEAIRLLTRAVADHDDDSDAHLALLDLHRRAERIGGWLAQAHRSGRQHGCPMEPALPWYPDQIKIDLAVATALMEAGRLDEAIALRTNRLEGAGPGWPRHIEILTRWRKDPRFVAWCYAREGAFRGDDARAVEGFGRIEPDDGVDLALFLDALVALGREDEVALAWGHLGRGRKLATPRARLAAARGLMVAGHWRAGVEELWRVMLGAPGRDDHAAIARGGRMLAAAPLAELEVALTERLDAGALTLARRMARLVADFVPGAASSAIVTRALTATSSRVTRLTLDPAALAAFPATTRSKAAIDACFAEALGGEPADDLARGDRLVDAWHEAVFAEASDDQPAGLAQAAAYAAACALTRYLAATTAPPRPLAGALRTVAAEALLLVRRHQGDLTDADARALLRAFDAAMPGVERGLVDRWLGVLERSLGLDERAAGDVAGFAVDAPRLAARMLGPEDVALRSAEVARLHRDRPEGWAAAVTTSAERLAWHTGSTGAVEWADAIAALRGAGELDAPTAIDALLTASYLAEGRSAGPCVQAAQELFVEDRGEVALATLCAGLGAAPTPWRDRIAPTLATGWVNAGLDVPFSFDEVASQMFAALQGGDPARAARLGRWAVAFDPSNAEAHRNLGLALAMLGDPVEALPHLVRATPEQATQILAGVLFQAGKTFEAMAVLDYASRWYVRAEQWLTYGGVAYGAMDNPRTVKAYELAYKLDPSAFDCTQLNAYAGVLDEVGDYATCERIAEHLLRQAGEELLWLTCGWNHLACAYIGVGRFAEAEALARRAIAQNPLPDNAAGFAATLARAESEEYPSPPQMGSGPDREPAFAALERGEHAEVAALLDGPSWRARRAALSASRFRFGSEDDVEVTPRAIAAAGRLLAATRGAKDPLAVHVRALALEVREEASFARDPRPTLGDRMTRDAFYAEFRARGGVVIGDDAPPPPPFVDREVVAGGKVPRARDYVALLRDLGARAPREALAARGLDDAGYLEVAAAWAKALDADPTLAETIAAGLRELAPAGTSPVTPGT